MGAGEPDKGREWIARGIEERDPLLVTGLKTGPTYDRLRSQPIYQELLRKMVGSSIPLAGCTPIPKENQPLRAERCPVLLSV